MLVSSSSTSESEGLLVDFGSKVEGLILEMNGRTAIDAVSHQDLNDAGRMIALRRCSDQMQIRGDATMDPLAYLSGVPAVAGSICVRVYLCMR